MVARLHRWPLGIVSLLVVLAPASCSLRGGDDQGPDCPGEVAGCPRDATVGNIGDGDSFRLEDGERVRLIGIDTPEVDEGECYAIEARDALRELMPRGSRIRLTFDEERTDRFGRTLAYVTVLGDEPTVQVNLELARLGYAEPLVVQPNDSMADEIAAAAADAREAGLGRWGACPAN